MWGTATRRTDEFRVEDTSYSILKFKNGVDGVVIVDELAEYARWDIELQFTHGKVALPSEGLWTIRPKDFEAGWWYELAPGQFPEIPWDEPAIRLAARDLIGAIKEGRDCRCTGADGRAAIEIIMAIYESERRGNTKVNLPLGLGESVLESLRREGRL